MSEQYVNKYLCHSSGYKVKSVLCNKLFGHLNCTWFCHNSPPQTKLKTKPEYEKSGIECEHILKWHLTMESISVRPDLG